MALLIVAEFCDVFCEESIFTIDQTRKILQTAKKYGLQSLIHVDEIVDTNADGTETVHNF